MGETSISKVNIFGLAGYSGSGKTTLIEKLIPLLIQRGLRVSLIKRAHHNFDVDTPGKDSYRHRQAGCTEILVTSSQRWVLMHELRRQPEPRFAELIKHISPCDLLLVEGFKHEHIPKIEVFRLEVGEPLLHPNDSNIVAIASDQRLETKLPQFDLNDAGNIADFMLHYLNLL